MQTLLCCCTCRFIAIPACRRFSTPSIRLGQQQNLIHGELFYSDMCLGKKKNAILLPRKMEFSATAIRVRSTQRDATLQEKCAKLSTPLLNIRSSPSYPSCTSLLACYKENMADQLYSGEDCLHLLKRHVCPRHGSMGATVKTIL